MYLLLIPINQLFCPVYSS